jgi:hypothetical protein
MEYNNTFFGDTYCVKCKDKVEFQGQVKTADSGRRMAQGICPQCGTKVNRILGASPNAPAPKIVPPAFQPGVPLKPEPKTYAKFEVYHKDGMWWVKAYDCRRPSYLNTETFYNFTRYRALYKAKRWLNAWEVIEFEEYK